MKDIILKNHFVSLRKINIAQAFYIVYSAAIIARIFCDWRLGRWGIHAGDIFPFRKLNPEVLPYSSSFYALEILLTITGVVVLLAGKVRWGAVLISLCFMASLTQILQHQKILMLIVALTLLILPVHHKNKNSVWFLKWQLIIVYGYSVLHKGLNQFHNGHVLRTVFQYLQELTHPAWAKTLLHYASQPGPSITLSILTLILELVIPIVLLNKAKWGIFLVIFFHLSLNLPMNDILPFSLTMTALSLLFLINADEEQKLDKQTK